MRSGSRSCFLALVFLTGCGTSRKDQLERVAKDWCETIRASQVIPVYPLTEDIQPGDVFLVQVPVDRQQEIYRKKGFLPLDNHLARLDPSGYPQFYQSSFFDGTALTLPRDWAHPGHHDEGSWQSAPGAAFPTYAFSVSRGAGMNLAVPISGVPVGLSLLGTRSADGSVSIKDARTMGVDTLSLYQQLLDWSAQPQTRSFLFHFGNVDHPRNYLRIITRVYAAGSMSVQLNDARNVSGGADGGVARPVDIFLPRTPTGTGDVRESTADGYARSIGHLNAMLADRDAPTHRSSSDEGLNAPELAARAKARAEARAAELAARERDRQTAGDEVETARGAARPHRDSLEAARAELAQRNAELEAAAVSLEAARADAAAVSAAEDAIRDAAAARVREAEATLAAAHDNVKQANATVTEQETEYAPLARALAEKQGRYDVAQLAVDRLASLAPGGSARFTAVSSRSVSMEESFDPPLVIGYLAFDVAIGPGGMLGAPIPTHAMIDPSFGGVTAPPAVRLRELNDNTVLSTMYDAVAADTESEAVALRRQLDGLARYIRADLPVVVLTPQGDRDVQAMTWPTANFTSYLAYAAERARSAAVLDAWLAEQAQAVEAASDVERPAAVQQQAHIWSLHKRFEISGQEHAEFAAARRMLLDYYQRTTVLP